jgi:Flp pilus assembly secretin CpaC
LGVASLGIVMAEDSKPTSESTMAKGALPQPLPVQPAPQPASPVQPPLPPVGKDSASPPPEKLEQLLKQLRQNLEPREQRVLIDVTCVQVPAGFVAECGLTIDNSTPKTGELCTFLNHREAKMLAALLRAYPGRRCISEPRVTLQDGQTGFMETGGAVEEVPTLVATTTNGETVYTSQMVRFTTSNIVLRVTAKISKDDAKIQLKVDREIAQVGEGVSLKPAERGDEELPNQKSSVAASINVDNAQVTVVVPDGGTVVMGTTLESTRDKTKKTELLWVFTPHLVRGKP